MAQRLKSDRCEQQSAANLNRTLYSSIKCRERASGAVGCADKHSSSIQAWTERW